MAVAQRRHPAGPPAQTAPTAVHRTLREAGAGPAPDPVALQQPRPVLFDGMADTTVSVARAYRFERARRSLRSERRDERRRADRRFWVALGVLAACIAVVAVATVAQLQQLFGI